MQMFQRSEMTERERQREKKESRKCNVNDRQDTRKDR
jgi:hypothetical protein